MEKEKPQIDIAYVERAAGQAILEKAMLLQKIDQLVAENASLRAELEKPKSNGGAQ